MAETIKNIVITPAMIKVWVIKQLGITDKEPQAQHKALSKNTIRYNLEDYFPGLVGKAKLIEYLLSTPKYTDIFCDSSWEDDVDLKEDIDIDLKIDAVVMLIVDLINSGL